MSHFHAYQPYSWHLALSLTPPADRPCNTLTPHLLSAKDSQVIYMANKYHIVNRKAKYGQAVAQDLCTQLGGNLSSFADVAENAKFLQELGYGTTDYTALWIGLFGDSPSSDKSAYKWISTGQSPNFQQPSSSHGFWQVLPDGTSQPSGNFSCVKVAQQYGYWADAACKTPYGFTCEIREFPCQS
jgi:hypothetical protein